MILYFKNSQFVSDKVGQKDRYSNYFNKYQMCVICMAYHGTTASHTLDPRCSPYTEGIERELPRIPLLSPARLFSGLSSDPTQSGPPHSALKVQGPQLVLGKPSQPYILDGGFCPVFFLYWLLFWWWLEFLCSCSYCFCLRWSLTM